MDLRKPLQGPRLVLANTTPDHLATLYDHFDSLTFEWLPYQPQSKQDFIEFITNQQLWVLLLESKPIGLVGYLAIVPIHKRLEIGHIILAPPYQGKKYAFEASALLILYAMDLGQFRIEWKTHHLNISSQKLALKLGFVFEGIFRNHMYYKGMHRNSYYYSIICQEFDGVKEHLVRGLKELGNWDLEKLYGL